MPSLLDKYLNQGGNTPIGGYEPLPEEEENVKRFQDFVGSLSSRYAGLDDYTERSKRASDFQTRVRRVIDGDTIETTDRETVRLVGIDTPETVHPNKAPQPFGQAASDKLKEVLPPGTPINMEPGFEDHDAYGRLLRFVEAAGGPDAEAVQVNKAMIRNGLANISSYDQPRKAAFLDALEEAVMDQVGGYSLKEHLGQSPTLEQLSAAQVRAGGAGYFNADGDPNNAIFAEAFNRDRDHNALASLRSKAEEAQELFNDVRKEVLDQENALHLDKGPEVTFTPEDATPERGDILGQMREDGLFMAPSGRTQGMLEKGNLDLRNRPSVDDSTVLSFSVNIDGQETLLPSVVNGEILSEDAAIEHFRRTGEHLGVFDGPESANLYAEALHDDYENGTIETGDRYVDRLDEFLPIRAGLEAAMGRETTAPVPRMENLRDLQVDNQGNITDQPGELVGGTQTRPLAGFAGLLDSITSIGKDKDQDQDNLVERYVTRFTESAANIGDTVNQPDLTIQKLSNALGDDLAGVTKFWSGGGLTPDVREHPDTDLDLLKRMAPQRLAEPGPVEFEKVEDDINLPFGFKTSTASLAEFGGSITPQVMLAAIGPGGIPASSIASTKLGTTLVRVGFNAVENLGLEALDPGPDGQIDALNALAIGAAAGLVFDGAGRIIDTGKAKYFPQSAIDEMVKANPELSARMLFKVEDQIEAVMEESRRIANQPGIGDFNEVERLLKIDDVAEHVNLDDLMKGDGFNVRKGNRPWKGTYEDVLEGARTPEPIPAGPVREVLEGKATNEVLDSVLSRADELTMDDVISDVIHNTAKEASEKVPLSRAVQVYKQNVEEAVQHLIGQQDYAGAWRTLHSAQVNKHMGKAEVREIKDALMDALDQTNPSKAQALRILEAQAEKLDINGPKGVVTLGDLVESPTKRIQIQDMLRPDPSEVVEQAKQAARIDPEAGYLANPFAGPGNRYSALPEHLKVAVRTKVIDKAPAYVEELTKWHNTVRDNLGRLKRAGLPQAEEISKLLDEARGFEEEAQGGFMAQLLDGSKEVRPMSRYLIEGGSHYVEGARKWADLTPAHQQWVKMSTGAWDKIVNMKSMSEFATTDFGDMTDVINKVFRQSVSVEGDHLVFRAAVANGGFEKIKFDIQDMHAAMSMARVSDPNADVLDAIAGMVMEGTTDYARKVHNQVIIGKITQMEKLMKDMGMAANDKAFITNVRRALTESGGSPSASWTMLKNFMAISRLPMVSISNVPQMTHTAIMFRAKNTARAMWRMHAPEWAGNTHKLRVRKMAFMDGAAADAIIQEQADLMSNFARRIPADIAGQAGRPDLAGIPFKARMADKVANAGRKIIGDYYGLKPTERYIRTVAAEAGRLHNGNMLLAARNYMDTPEGTNALRMAWSISENINPEDAFFRNAWNNTVNGAGWKAQSLVHDLKQLGQFTDIEDLMSIKQYTPDQIKGWVDEYFDTVAIKGPKSTPSLPGMSQMPDVIQRSMGRSGKLAAESSQFRVGLQDLPVSLNAPGGGREFFRTVMQFRTFNFKHFDGFLRRYIKDEAKRGNMVPLLRTVAVGVPFIQLTGEITGELKDFINGGEKVGGSWVDLAVDRAADRITDEEFDRRLTEMTRPDILAMRSFENFQAWGGLGTLGEPIDAAQRGLGSIPSLVAGAGPSSLISGAYQFTQGEYQKGVEQIVGNPFGVTKFLGHRINEAQDEGRKLEEFRPPLLERMVRTEDQARARVVQQDADIYRAQSNRDVERREALAPDPEIEGLPDELTPRAEEGRVKAERQADSNRIKVDFIDAVMQGDLQGQAAAMIEARKLNIRMDFDKLRRFAGGAGEQ